ncbi:tRNA (adenine(58)-N(1))-methyltransferase catalytic subunit trm61 [Lachnellula arida]|uniref:tRNA (adenine(58)-N(1))-methyltransferase catalytic subunit TRM61 n=1 Tax=Lachnellula arida TaxID=1316785 RepID=A0A8T9B9D7_9HELO|nr:tRNA (adenine(58)-N(1))-methyltransferase catalytic subunit trm61 [Lachnellula arida]
MTSHSSPFLHPGAIAKTDRLSIVHLKRDLQAPTILRDHDEDDEGYSEGKVVNTRFGSFPHTTLIGLPWGTQVRASKVDTGSRGRRGQKQEKKQPQEKKRKREDPESTEHPNKRRDSENGEVAISTPAEGKEEKEAETASSGFIHLLPPTPENWTSSLPHRTQVVYTPDYSYILHRIRARPGSSIIEAGAGSGSFTHASARAVFRGYPGGADANGTSKEEKLGKVWSFEFHEQRHQKLGEEIKEHGLDGVVQITHRDVCEDGFLVEDQSPKADAIFLDLPAPWLALPHLTRSSPPPKLSHGTSEAGTPAANGTSEASTTPFLSALNPTKPVHLCTFSPCIEQVQRTISAMRKLGWVDIEMVELAQKRFEVRRERIGIDNGAQRGLQTTPASVDEALARLIEVEGTFKTFHETGEKVEGKKDKVNPNNREKILESLVDRKVYKEGNLVHRCEPEVKTHTSYLVFAVLPQEWSAEDEKRARAKWEVKIRTEGEKEGGEVIGISRRQLKKAARQAQKDKAVAAAAAGAEVGEKEIEETPEGGKEDKIEPGTRGMPAAFISQDVNTASSNKTYPESLNGLLFHTICP